MSHTVLDEAGLQRALTWLFEHPDTVIALDTETTGLRVAGGDSYVIGASLAWRMPGLEHPVSIYVPLHHPAGWNVGAMTRDQLRYVLTFQPRRIIYANVQFDTLGLEIEGFSGLAAQDFYDICGMAHLVDENNPVAGKSLDALGLHYVGLAKISDEYVEKEKKTGNRTITYEQMWEYATVDAENTLLVYEHLLTLDEWNDLPAGMWAHKQEMYRVLMTMARRGVRIDQDLAREQVSLAKKKMDAAKAGMGLGPNDTLGPKALERILHDDLKIPVLHRTKTNKPGFDKVAMAVYDPLIEASESPVGTHLKEYRGWQKTSTAAYQPYLTLLDSDGRLRCSYKLHGTTTGRLSCSGPNLQQIPKETDKPWNGRVKECFVADPGYTLVNADFSQLELRLATAYAPDPKLVSVFAEGRDIFTEMAQQLGMKRHETKTLVYSMQYGAGINRLMQAFSVSKERAEEIRQNYYATYPLFRHLADRATEVAEQNLAITMWSGRKRRFRYKNEGYKAMNAMIQGGAADIVERIMVRLYHEIDSDDCRMLLQVHDSVTFEIRTDQVADYIPRIRAVMEDVDSVIGFSTGVRFAVDITPWSAVEAAKFGKAA